MNVKKLMERIESHELATMVNAASNFRVAMDIALNQHEVGELFSAMTASPRDANEVINHAIELTQELPDFRYENPYDVALMIYAWLLYSYKADYGFVMASAIHHGCNLWWAHKQASLILERGLDKNGGAGESSTLPSVNKDAGDRMFIPVVPSAPVFTSHVSLHSPTLSSHGETVTEVGQQSIRLKSYGTGELDLAA